jgi:hypothetical protein
LSLRKRSNLFVKHQYPELFNPDVIAITTPGCAAVRLTSARIGKGARDLLWRGGPA